MSPARHLNAGISEDVGMSQLSKKQVKRKNSPGVDYVLFYNLSESYDNFSIITRENKTFLLEAKESSLVMSDKPLLNRNFSSASLYQFNKP